MRDKMLIYVVMAIAVPIAGELKFYPLQGDLRVSLGTPVFFFFLLWARRINPIVSGIIVGTTVVLFRDILYTLTIPEFIWHDAVALNVPAFFYYLVFASLFYLLKIGSYIERPFIIGILGTITEIAASFAEIFVRSGFKDMPITGDTFLTIGGIAIIRTFFVLGFFNIFILRETRIAQLENRKRSEEVLMMVSNLYVEMVQLNKTSKDAEEITSECYNLHQELEELKLTKLSKKALRLTGEIHEIKKDTQRIYAGLNKLMEKEDFDDFMSIQEIIDVIITSNRRYSELLNKEIHFSPRICDQHPPYHAFRLASLINNVVSNAVEAIKLRGQVDLLVRREQDKVIIEISDTGPGISTKNKTVLFEPGFTTKYDALGNASNGIGLYHVKNVVETLDGEIVLVDSKLPFKMTFTMTLPVQSIAK